MWVAFSKPPHTARPRIDPPGANHDHFTAKPSSCHVHSTLQVTPPTSPCPTLSADAGPACQRAETIFSAQCTVWRYQKCTIGFKGLLFHRSGKVAKKGHSESNLSESYLITLNYSESYLITLNHSESYLTTSNLSGPHQIILNKNWSHQIILIAFDLIKSLKITSNHKPGHWNHSGLHLITKPGSHNELTQYACYSRSQIASFPGSPLAQRKIKAGGESLETRQDHKAVHSHADYITEVRLHPVPLMHRCHGGNNLLWKLYNQVLCDCW